MLSFSDLPYRYYPPKPSRILIRYLKHLNRRYLLPGPENRVQSVSVRNAEQLDAVKRSRDAHVLFVVNHPSHSDPPIIMETLHVLGVSSLFMAAYDVFTRSRLRAWIMQRAGAFSVDRDATDRQAMRQALDTLVSGRYALTIFPEGNVYLRNDAVTPFLDGASLLALKACRELCRVKTGETVVAVPLAIKMTHATDVSAEITKMLTRLANVVGLEVQHDESPGSEIRRIGLSLLRRNLKQRGHELPGDSVEHLVEILEGAARSVLDRLEQRMELTHRAKDAMIERVRRIRRAVHQIRTDPAQAADHAVAATWADEAMLAFRIASYADDYVGNDPTIDRVAETVEKLSEDIYSRPVAPYANRHALVDVGTPMDLGERVAAYTASSRTAVQALTRDWEAAVQNGIDRLNADNPHPGAHPFTFTPTSQSDR